MKLTAFILLIGCLHAAATGHSQGVTITLKNVPLEKAFTAIEKESGYYFTYTKEQMEGTKNVSLDVRNADIKDVLELCFNAQPVTYEMIDKAVVVKKRVNVNVTSTTLPELITGVITDSTGKPLQGANIEVKGTKKRTTTDSEGRFVIDAKEGDVLVVSYVGFGRQEVTVGKETVIRVSLNVSVTEIEGVTINTGYQKISPQNFVGSYSQLDSQAFHRRAGMGIIDRLDGTVPSVLFNKKGSIYPLQVRGISTINSFSAPLIVVDDFPVDQSFLDNLNPNDVESVTVLKDAAAASIWGTRAGNGVIVITTKRGQYGRPFQFTVSSNVTITEKPDLYHFPQVSSSDFIDYEQFLFSNGAYNSLINNTTQRPVLSPVVEILAQKRAGQISAATADAQINALRNVDVRKELDNYVYRPAASQQHYLSFGGGTNKLAYNLSFGYNNRLNNIQGSKPFDQFTISNSTSFKPVEKLELSLGLSLAQATNRSTDFAGNINYPYLQLADAEGNALAIPYLYRQGWVDTLTRLQDWHYRPLDEIREVDRKTLNRFAIFNVAARYKLFSWLNASVSYQYTSNMANTRNLKGLGLFETRDLINRYTNLNQTVSHLRNPVPIGSMLDITNSQFTQQNVRGSMNVNKNWGSQHQLTAMVAAEVSESKGNSNSERLYGYNEKTGSFLSNIDYRTNYPLFFGGSNPPPSGTSSFDLTLNRFVSFLGNASYTFQQKYSLYASARRDGSNVFGVKTNDKWKPLWSVGGSWDISKEGFYHVDWLSSLRLRATYGYTGNVNNIMSGVYTMTYSPFLSTFTNYLSASHNGATNPNLRWEQVRTINLGVDFGVFNNRLSGSFEVFNRRMTDLISNQVVDPTTGSNTFPLNWASMKGRGFDFILRSQNTTGALQWSSSLSISYVKTIITDVFYSSPYYNVNGSLSYGLNPVPGQIAFGLASLRWAGLDPATGDPMGYYRGVVSKQYQLIMQDSMQNQVFHGSQVPLYSGFFTNTLNWKGFSLSANITGRFNYYFREPAWTMGLDAGYYPADYYRRWQKPGDEAVTNVPSLLYPVPSSVSQRAVFYRNAEIMVRRGDHIRLQDVRLSYSWQNKNRHKLPVRNIQVFAYPNNLNIILWRADDSMYDPDLAGVGSTPQLIPPQKTWTAGVTVNF